MSSDLIIRYRDEVIEGTDNWNVAAVAINREDYTTPVLITQSDVSGVIALDIYPPASSTAVYSTTFAKTLTQGGSTEAIHTALVDSRWRGKDTTGHNFSHYVKESDVGAGVLEGGRLYTMVYAIPTVLDGTIYLIFEWDIQPRH